MISIRRAPTDSSNRDLREVPARPNESNVAWLSRLKAKNVLL